MTGFLALSDETLDRLGITAAEIADCIETAVLAEARGTLWTAPKAALLPGDGRYAMATLALGDGPGVTAVKSVMVCPDNPARGLSSINGAILLLDAGTGLLRAVMGANWVTAVRTAGLSAVAARRLADPRSASVAFVGCGTQARSHLAAFADLFPLEEIRAYGRGSANTQRLSADARERGLRARACQTPRAALEGADLVVSSITLDYDVEPFLDARWLKPGAFAAITDLAIPWAAESMPAFDTVVIDDEAQETASPRPMVAPGLVSGDLAALVTGGLAAGFAPEKRSAFVFRGIAVGDIAVAALALERAEARGLGTKVNW